MPQMQRSAPSDVTPRAVEASRRPSPPGVASTAPGGARIDALTSLRFVAAAMIVFLHSQGFVGLYYPWLEPLPLVHGVSFFFVLSGFILAYVYPTLSWRAAPAFWWARIARIWPAHAATFLLALILLRDDGLAASDTIVTAVANLLLVHAWIPVKAFFFSFNAPSWSVSTELGFYLLFPLLIHRLHRTWAVKLGASLLLLIVALILANRLDRLELLPGYVIDLHGLAYISPVARLFEFVLGMCTWLLWQRLHRRVRLGVGACTIGEFAAFGLALLLMYLSAKGVWFWRAILGEAGADWSTTGGGAALGFAAIILVVAFDRGLGARVLRLPILVLLGELSYSVYLVHQLVLRELDGKGWIAAVPVEVRFPAFWLVVIVLSYAIWRFVERPARVLLRSIAVARPSRRGVAAIWRRAATDGPSIRLVLASALVAAAWASAAILVRVHSPTHVMWHDFMRDGGPEAPVADLTVAAPTRWTVEQRQTYGLAATNRGQRTWFTTEPARVFVHVLFVSVADADRIDERAELWLPIGGTVAPGGRLEMDLNVRAPRKEGPYRLVHRVEIDPYFRVQPTSVHEVSVVVRTR